MIFLGILIFYLSLSKIKCNDIIGCGGFIRTDIKQFSFEKLSAHLTFVDGTVNYVTDILPNGAYSVPIYDLGVYIIKIVGPSGWSIEPAEGYQIVINNQEACTDDYNFKFTGFSISGKVSTANINHGPSGILIDLIKDGKNISQAVTVEGGDFTITNVMPGNYSLNFKSETVDGKSLELNDTSYNLEILNDNVVIKESFIIYGYPVFGDVKFYGESVEGVEIYLFSRNIDIKNFNFSRYKCLKVENTIARVDGYNVLCKVHSNSKGHFIFPLLPGGNYLLIPVYQTNISVYDIQPITYELEIRSNSIDLRSVFQITGFSVFGQVINFNGNPIHNAEIFIEGNFLTKSNLNGSFSLKGMKKGTYEIFFKLDGFVFNKTLIDFNPKNSNIGIFSPEKTSICGSIITGSVQSADKEVDEVSFRRKILLVNGSTDDVIDSMFTKIQYLENINDKNEPIQHLISVFCFYVKPGVYIIRPVIEPPMLSLAPKQIKVVLISSPVNVKFSPFRGSISGIVTCIEKCNTGEFEVTLKSSNEDKDSMHFTQHISISNEFPNKGTFQFKDIIPGSYHIELISANGYIPLDKTRWCWSKSIIPVDIMDSSVNGLLFEQIGFSVPIHSTHDFKITYFHSSNPNTSMGTENLFKGLSKLCLPKSGHYEFRIDMCHKLENKSIFVNLEDICKKQFDFRDPLCHLKINVTEFKVKINFEFLENIDVNDLKNLENDVKGVLSLGINAEPIVKDIKWENGKGSLYFWVKPDVYGKVHVNSLKYLVNPKQMDFKLSKDTIDCIMNIGTFKLERGTFISGSVLPALKEVTIEIRKKISSLDEDDIESVIGTSKTNEDGKFSIGPLNSTFKYDLKLYKNGYKIVKNLTLNKENYFHAYKLAELVVDVLDNVTGKALSGILLSIVGDGLRKNELTNEYGQFIFVGLTPGVYYLRAMMKELEFIPQGAVEVIITEGSMEKILIRAARTSFSLHGKVVSLNGEPEVGVIVEGSPIKHLIDRDNSDLCKKHLVRNEHATTDETGAFRIRGLQPECHYKLILKNGNNNDENFLIRSYPNNIKIKMLNKDFRGMKIYALRNINVREISAVVWTSLDIYQSSLQLLVFPSDNPDNVIAAHKFSNEGIYFQMVLPPTPKRVEYVIRLQSNLNPNLFSNISAQERTLILESEDFSSIYKHFEFHFYPIKRTIGDADTNLTFSSSIMLPLIVIIFSILLFNKESLEPLISKVLKIIKSNFNNTFKHSNIGLPSNSGMKSTVLDPIELSELNNAIAKSKPPLPLPPVKKTPFWLRPKKA